MIRRLLTFSLIALASAGFGACSHAEPFDKPTRTTILDLGSSPDQPDFPNLHRHLSCWYYTGFMVKQLDDDGNKGALRISITRSKQGSIPACTRSYQRGEIIISDGWDYYWGAKKGVVVLIGADGSSGGMNFDIFNVEKGVKIFKDHVLRTHATQELNFIPDANRNWALKYQRVFYADCSLAKDGAGCWNKLVRKAGLEHAPLPKCDYAAARDDLADPSVISYPVQVVLSTPPKQRVLSQTVKCWAAE